MSKCIRNSLEVLENGGGTGNGSLRSARAAAPPVRPPGGL
eukprot:CAMPEP_0195074984 /NCGR_PEP_ID=MMETSP0448-20130528/17966_1 /TAXON_ID=66468 /ORGANISM="Heterocapsa triquestra, Strain CCMP 448" /LENGTH=39 /DNA_ID= /DNA_START= /DNA_END= /DNA_ORIENTATION=